MNHANMTREQIKRFIWDAIIKHKDKEEENKLNPAWKKLRRNTDAIHYRLPGSFDK
jgi:hypothetical protein